MEGVKYIVEDKNCLLWGLAITTVGVENIEKGEEYPTKKHLKDYYFSTKEGRILQEYQMVYISEGRGFFETQTIKKVPIEAGTIFLLFPDEWHTYYPDPLTGWKQYWIGFKGVNIDVRVNNGFLSKKNPIYHVGVDEEIVHLFHQAIEVAERENAYFQQLLAGIANHLLGLMYCLDRNNQFNKSQYMVDKINQARVLMHENLESTISVQDIAERVGMSYSSFRKLFKEYTGLSPASYFQDLKLQRAKDLLRFTQYSIKEIAYSLNFESPDYFSTQFRKKVGKKPSDFRDWNLKKQDCLAKK
mgnify:FL=1